MGEVLPKHYIIGIIMFVFIIMSGISLLSALNDTDPTYIDNTKFTEFNDTFNKYNEITTKVDGLKSGIEDAEPGQDYGTLGVLSALISSGWNTLQLLFQSFGFMNDVFNGLSDVFGIPYWVPVLIISIVTTILVFAIYGAIFQREL